MLTIRYLCYHRHRRGNNEKLMERMLDEFEKEGKIDLAYPTTRIYKAQFEAKDELRPNMPNL
tara:strand:- start:185 stop:370 length:186 start_codon:yes stop_codon:yes gene_type:complete